jgi:hypothetical protein
MKIKFGIATFAACLLLTASASAEVPAPTLVSPEEGASLYVGAGATLTVSTTVPPSQAVYIEVSEFPYTENGPEGAKFAHNPGNYVYETSATWTADPDTRTVSLPAGLFGHSPYFAATSGRLYWQAYVSDTCGPGAFPTPCNERSPIHSFLYTTTPPVASGGPRACEVARATLRVIRSHYLKAQDAYGATMIPVKARRLHRLLKRQGALLRQAQREVSSSC